MTEVRPSPARPKMVQPLVVILPQVAVGHDSGEDGDTLTTILRCSKQLSHVGEASPSTRGNLEETGSTEELFGEEQGGEEEEEEEEERESKFGRESLHKPASCCWVGKTERGKVIAARHIVKNAVNITMDGKVSVTPCILTEKDLNGLRTKYGRMECVILRLPSNNEVACSNLSSEFCLYEHMFTWGMRITMGERPWGQMYLVAMFAFYGLSPK